MADLAYMVREDWGQRGTGMVPQSKVIRSWAGESPYYFAVFGAEKIARVDRSADLEAVRFLASGAGERRLLDYGTLARLSRESKPIGGVVLAVHPDKPQSTDLLREAVDSGTIERLFVLIWSGCDRIRNWLDARGALDLHAGRAMSPPDPLMVEAGRMMIGHQYNGLESGLGKDAVVQLVRAFAASGYPMDADAWMRAYFAAGGDFRHVESISRLVREMQAGTKHRVRPRYRDNIVEVIKTQLADDRGAASVRGQAPCSGRY